MTHSKRRAHPPRPRPLAPVAPKEPKPTKKIVACYFCKKEVDKENFCHGCKTVVCDECDVAAPNVPWGPHDPEAHLEEHDEP